jgi:hypothetical protein
MFEMETVRHTNLSCSRLSHKCRQLSGGDITENFIQQCLFFTRHPDIVRQVLPRKYVRHFGLIRHGFLRLFLRCPDLIYGLRFTVCRAINLFLLITYFLLCRLDDRCFRPSLELQRGSFTGNFRVELGEKDEKKKESTTECAENTIVLEKSKFRGSSHVLFESAHHPQVTKAILKREVNKSVPVNPILPWKGSDNSTDLIC